MATKGSKSKKRRRKGKGEIRVRISLRLDKILLDLSPDDLKGKRHRQQRIARLIERAAMPVAKAVGVGQTIVMEATSCGTNAKGTP